MKTDLTELVFILDKSGSMGGLEADTIGGFNSMLNEQKGVKGECIITTVLFDHRYQLLHDRIDIKAVSPISGREYKVGGNTALLDAIGRTIEKIGTVQKHTAAEYRAEKVMFVIITDGEENASREYNANAIKALIERHKADYGWEFAFLGANIDAVETASHFGIDSDRAATYLHDSEGTRISFSAMGSAAREFREQATISEAHFCRIREDEKKRGGCK